jgi:hypothetical protein
MKIVRFIFTNLLFLAIYLFVATTALQAAETTPTQELQNILQDLSHIPDSPYVKSILTTVRNLLTQGADPNARYAGKECSPFLFAVRSGDINLVNVFFEPTAQIKPDFTVIGKHGWTVLHYATEPDNLVFLQEIVKKNNTCPHPIAPTTPDRNGTTILHYVLNRPGTSQRLPMSEYIINLAPDMQTARNIFGLTPLENLIADELAASRMLWGKGPMQHQTSYYLDLFELMVELLQPEIRNKQDTFNGALAAGIISIIRQAEFRPYDGATAHLVPGLTLINHLQTVHRATLDLVPTMLASQRRLAIAFPNSGLQHCGAILLIHLAYAYNINTMDRALTEWAHSLLNSIIPMPGVITEDDKKYITDPTVKSDFRNSGVNQLRRLPDDIQTLLTRAGITLTPTARAGEPARAGAPTPRSATTPSPATAPAPAGGGKHPSDPFGLAAAAQPQDVTLQTLVKVLHVASTNCTHLVQALCKLHAH